MNARFATDRTWLAIVAGLGLAVPATAQLSQSLFHDPAYEVDDSPFDVVAADFDGDARMDLVASCVASDTIRVLLGAGDGSFPDGLSIDVPSAGHIVVGDFNEDGALDLATGCCSNLISMLLGDGDGSFALGTPVILQDVPTLLAQADFDMDGHADLITIHFFFTSAPGSVEVLLGNGDATFASQSVTGVGVSPAGLAVADFDTDGQPDVAVANSWDGTYVTLLGQGDGSFASLSPVFLGGGGGTASFAVGDFNEDGLPDMGVGGFADTAYVGMFILLGGGDGTFVEDAFHLVHGPFVVDDLDQDGHLDIACASGTILLGEGDGDFVTGSYFSNGAEGVGVPVPIAGADYDGDGHLDLATCNGFEDRVAIRFGEGDGTFLSVINPADITGQEPRSVVTGDLDGDGFQDAVVANTAVKWVTTYLGQSEGGLEKFGTFGIAQQPSAVALADFNSDGWLDAVAADHKADKVSILLGSGTGGLMLQSSFAVGDEPLSVAVGDFNEDGRADVVTGNHGGDSVSVLLGHGNGSFAAASTIPAGLDPVFVAVGDFDADASQDLAVVNDSDTITILEGHGIGSFVLADSLPVAAAATSVAVADVDADGWQDLVVGHDAGTDVTLLLGSASGFVAGSALSAGTRPVGVAASDLDGNGSVDVATANAATATVSVLLGAGDGSFEPNGQFVCTQGLDESRAIAIADFDNDAWPDLVVMSMDSYYFDGAISVLMNKGPSPWKDLGLALAGSLQEPQLTGSGPLVSSSDNSVELTYAKSTATAVLVAGFEGSYTPLKGGTLVPAPQVLVFFHVPATGALELPFHMPPFVPAGLTLYSQCWLLDDQAAAGWAATNGLLGVTP